MVTPETRQARGYAFHICILLKNISDLELGDSEEFPPLKILIVNTVGRYIAINDKIAVDNVEGLAGKSRVKKTPVKRVVSKKRPAVSIDEQVVNKKRTLKGKAAPSKAKLELVSVALDAEPIQTVDPTSADDVDTIIEIVLDESAQLDTDVGSPVVQKSDEMEQWFNISYEEFVARGAEKLVETASDSDGAMETVACGTVVTAAEVTKIKFDLAVQIHEVKEKDWYYGSLPKISAHDKGNKPLEATDVVKENPASKMLTDLESIRVIAAKEKHMLYWAETTSLETSVKGRMYIIVKYRKMLLRKFVESHRKYFAPGQPWTAMDSQIIDLLSAAHLQSLDALMVQEKEHGLIKDIVVKSSVVDILEKVSTDFCDVLQQGTNINNFVEYFNDSIAKPILQFLPEVELVSSDVSTVYRSPYPQSLSSSSNQLDVHLSSPMDEEVFASTAVGSTPGVAQFSLPPVVSESFNDLRASMSRIISNKSKESKRLDDSHNETKLELVSSDVSTVYRSPYPQSLSSSSNQLDVHLSSPMDEEFLPQLLLDLPLNQASHGLIKGIRQEARNDTDVLSLGLKAVRTQTAILSTDQADARKEAKEKKAIIADMDERLATVRRELLDFRAQAQENYNNLSSQLGELVAYINRGNDIKGEESSSRRPQPPPDDQNRPSGGSASRGGGGGGSGGSGRRDDRRGSSTKRGSSSVGGVSGTAGGPYKKNAEWWLYGKNQF
ncbi:hypothetical protein F511_38221 [Dorcoceras hygrometricum]|uniref:Uncharacterized protein n=1 Tax=Dorcoceras hygrometricum TaxID=472368 RepID=A0A2Z7CDE5_9LAMI|nr:hypothetical protein F511_38221 [Dorcoceras hygrometricum]